MRSTFSGSRFGICPYADCKKEAMRNAAFKCLAGILINASEPEVMMVSTITRSIGLNVMP